MKSEHRRELHANELEKLTENIGKFFERYGSKILIGLVVAVAIGVAVFFYLRSRGEAYKEGSRRLLNAQDSESLLNVALDEDLEGEPMAVMARLMGAERQLADANQMRSRSSKAALKEMDKAKENFLIVLDADDLSANARERALYGVASVLEALSKEDTSSAIDAYKKLLKEFPQSLYKSVAEYKIKSLKRDDVKQLMAYLAQVETKPEDRKVPKDTISKTAKRKEPPVEEPITLPRIPNRLRMLRKIVNPFPVKKTSPDGKTPAKAKKPRNAASSKALKFPEKTAPPKKTTSPPAKKKPAAGKKPAPK